MIETMNRITQLVRRWWAPILVIAIMAVGILTTYRYWCWLTENGTESASATIRNMGLVIAAPVALVLAIWRSLVAEKQANIAALSLEEGRFQKASEMLGSESPSVRLGGIDALEKLARDNPGEFHLQVVRSLAAHVRHLAKGEATQSTDASEPGYDAPSSCREEVQVILVFFGERTAEGRQLEKQSDIVIDLQGSDLQGVWLSTNANLERVRLSYSNLSGAVFSDIKGLSRNRLVGVYADPGNPPEFRNMRDCETAEPLNWPLSS